MMHSVKICGGLVVDGTGRLPYTADVVVKNGIIEAIEPDIIGGADKIINGTGLIVSPGFIDIHSHADVSIFRNPLSDSKLLQGVTTEVVGNCGIGLFPVIPELAELLTDYLQLHETSFPPEGLNWQTFDDYAGVLEDKGLGVNFVPLVAHGTLRLAVMGMAKRRIEPEELAKMEELLDLALTQGAWGLSGGLIYPPGSYAEIDELIALAKVVAEYDCLFAAHIRNEGDNLSVALREMVTIGQISGARMQVSHLKAIGKANWGRAGEALMILNQARQGGIDISADQYPYAATSTSLTALVPQEALEGGPEELLRRLNTAEDCGTIKPAISREIAQRGGADNIMITAVGTAAKSPFSGRTVADLATEWRCGNDEAVIRLLVIGQAIVSAVFFTLAPEDVAVIAADQTVAVGSDGYGLSIAKDGAVATHPRSYGTFPRFLAKFVVQGKRNSWQEAIGKMTGLAAARLRLSDRGALAPGKVADITIFDPTKIADQANYVDCHRYASGIEYVLVNGQAAVWEGQLTGDRPGRVLRRR
ncbi:MAG: amidohydrolase [Firmicutes bacterium]|nr:amidohydrolase [Bacillota bacterium]